ncbi:MAG: hypothetical protein KDA87_10670 [Planctomycetales bacterium]|nr:hypothetical protein [Planctomycetales bacterium]
MGPSEYYQAGQLREAISAAINEVKASPTDTAKRFQLCELCCFAGDWERADRQLDTIMQQTTDAVMQITLVRQLIRAELARTEFLLQGRLPEFVADVTPHLRLHLDASIAIREGNAAEAAKLLEQAEQQRTQLTGTLNGKSFDDFRDLDDLISPFFEVFTSNGKYFLLPIEQVESITFRPPKRPMDLIWRSITVSVANGPDGEVYMPAIYPQTHVSGDNQLMLGRGTDWTDGDASPVRGIGLRMFLAGDQDVSVMNCQEIHFDRPSN